MQLDHNNQTAHILHARYPQLKNPLRSYNTLCVVLRERGNEIAWDSFSPVDWQELQVVARTEQVSQMLYWLWETKTPVGVTKEMMMNLGTNFVLSEAGQTNFYREFTDRIFPALDGIDGPLVVLKGGALAQSLYPHPALRPMGDLDILVPKEQIGKVVERLKKIGYTDEAERPLEGQTAKDLTLQHHIVLISSQPDPIIVEVHYTLGHSSTNEHHHLPLDWFWANLLPLTIQGKTYEGIYMFAPAPQLLHLAIHLTLQHGEVEMTLLKYYDIHLLITKWGQYINWNELLAQTQRLGLSAALRAALIGCVSRFGTSLPDNVLSTLAEAAENDLIEEEVQRKAQPENIGSSTKVHTTKIWFTLLGDISWRLRIRLLWEYLAPTPEYMRWRYHPKPHWIWPLYYSVRWVRAVQGIAHIIKTGLWKIKKK